MNNYPLPPHLRHSTAFLIVRVMKEGYRRANTLFGGEKLRLMHYAAAAYIAEYKDMSQKTLSELLLMDPSDIGSIVHDLEAVGYVARQIAAHDRRRLRLTITSEGRAWLARREVAAQQFEDNFLQTLTPKNRKKLHALLSEMIRQ